MTIPKKPILKHRTKDAHLNVTLEEYKQKFNEILSHLEELDYGKIDIKDMGTGGAAGIIAPAVRIRFIRTNSAGYITRNADFNLASSTWTRDDEAQKCNLVEWGEAGLQLYVANSGGGTVSWKKVFDSNFTGTAAWVKFPWKCTFESGGVYTVFETSVGIGTTTPTHPLQIQSDVSTAISATTIDDSSMSGLRLTNADNTTGAGAVITMNLGATGTAQVGIAGIRPSADNSDLAFYTESSGSVGERMRIRGANIGIGTATPSAYADLTLENGVCCLKETTTPTADANYGKIYTKNDNVLYFQDGAGTESALAMSPAAYAFKTITGITNDVVADAVGDTLTLASTDAKLTIVGTTATDTITFSVIEGQIDHNALTNYAANEHIDWTGASDNFSTTGTLGCNAITMTQNSDTVTITSDGSNPFIKWSDGNLNLITDEGTNANTLVYIKGKGTGYGVLRLYDEDNAERLEMFNLTGYGYIRTAGTSPNDLHIQNNVAQDIKCWASVTSGNPYFYLYGFGTSAAEYLRMRVESDNDALIEAEHDLNINASGGQIFMNSGDVALGADGATQGILTLWDGAGGNTPGYTKIHSPNGTAWYLFVEDDGTVKVHNAAPTANADGDAVGDQTD